MQNNHKFLGMQNQIRPRSRYIEIIIIFILIILLLQLVNIFGLNFDIKYEAQSSIVYINYILTFNIWCKGSDVDNAIQTMPLDTGRSR